MNPIDQLQDIHLPEQISAWPPAYGWWLLLALLLAVLIASFLLIRSKRQHNMARKAAIQQLKHIDKHQAAWQSDINALLKRVCVSYFPTENAAGLYGQDWIEFLSDKLPEKAKSPFVETMTAWQKQLYRSPDPTEESNAKIQTFEHVQAQALIWLQRFNSKTVRES